MNENTTSSCKECAYFENIGGVKTCGRNNTFIGENVVGCYAGSKVRNQQTSKQTKEV